MEQYIPIWLLVFFGSGGLITGIIAGWREYTRWRVAKNNGAFSRTLPLMHRVYESIFALKSSIDASSVVVCASENGGGVPTVGSQLYSSLLYEVNDATMQPIRESWQRQQLDLEYVGILSTMLTVGPTEIHTADMQGGILKDLFLRHNIESAVFVKVAETSRKLIYLYCAFTNDKGTDTPLVRERLRDSVSILSRYFTLNNALV